MDDHQGLDATDRMLDWFDRKITRFGGFFHACHLPAVDASSWQCLPDKDNKDVHMAITDQDLEVKIAAMQAAITQWAKSHELWYDTGFQTYAYRVDAEPGEDAVVFVQHFTGHLRDVIDGSFDSELYDEFVLLVESHGFWFENIDGVSIHFHASEPEWTAAFDDYFRWKWICSLVQEDRTDVYEELYSHFAAKPEDLYRLGHRQFEIMLFRIFQNQGFEAELGPGSGDGGVDVRFFQRGPLRDLMTLVQVKRYAKKRKISLEAVAALRGVVANDNAHKGIFVTTSAYLPSAKEFAARSSGTLDLRTSEDVAIWCRDATDGVIEDKSKLVSDEHLIHVIKQVSGVSDYRVLHASTGYQTVQNGFALVLKESKHAALLLHLPKRTVFSDLHGIEGTEIAVIDETLLGRKTKQFVFRAKRIVDESGRVSYWNGKNLYWGWDGQPKFFSWMD